MIHFQITDSIDSDVIEEFKYFQNQLYLGKKEGNLIIHDPQLRDTHVMIEIVEGELLIHPQRGVDFYLIDGKRATTIRKIKAHQKITIGSTTLRILDFAETSYPSKKSLLDEKMSILANENSPKMAVIEKIAQMMK